MADRESFDTFLGDMAAGQSRAGEVTPRANQALAADVFQRLDQKREEQNRRLTPASVPDPTPDADAEPRASDLEAKRRGYRILRGGDLSQDDDGKPRRVVQWGVREQWFHAAVKARVALMLSLPERGILGAPSWRERTMAVLSLAATGQRELAARQMFDLCLESQASLGPLFVERAPKVFVGGAR